jgi:predicted AlkP superfamily phosphohydrolase/phosphomutase
MGPRSDREPRVEFQPVLEKGRRTLSSAVIAAALLAADIAALTLILNPGVSLRSEAAPILVSLFAPYLAGLTLLYLALVGVLSVYQWWPRLLRRPVGALPWFTALSFVSLSAGAALYWFNLWSYRDSISLASISALRGVAIGLSIAAAALAVVAVEAVVRPYRRRGGASATVVLASSTALVAPLALRPAEPALPAPVPLRTELVEPARRITLIGIDGVGAAQLEGRAAAAELPSFASLIDRGAFGALETLQPTEGPPVWTSIFTGRSPRFHGVKSFVTYRLRGSSTSLDLLPKGALVRLLEAGGLVSSAPVTAASRRGPALWTALNAFGIQTGIVRFWGTYPPEPVQGFMLSNYFHLVAPDPIRVASALHPPQLAPEVAARAVAPGDVERALVSDLVNTDEEVAEEQAAPLERELVERALAPDVSYRRAAEVLRSAYAPPFFASYVYGTDVVGHAFTRFAYPDRFGDVPEAEARRYGDVVSRYTELVGSWIAERAATLGPGEILLVVSGYGMEPLPLWRRVAAILTGAPAVSGTHAGAPDGFLIAVGDGVRPGARLRSASVLDIAPTVLHLMGLPVARDMEGRVLTEILDEELARSRPLTFIPSYSSLAVTPTVDEPDLKLPPPMDEQP